MKALLWIGGFVLLIGGILCLRLRLFAEYGENGANLQISFGFLKLWLPRSTNKTEKSLSLRKQMQKMEIKGEKHPGLAENFRKLLPIIGETLGKLRTRLTVDELTFRYLSAAKDPAMAALQFGTVNAAAALLLNPLEALFRIRKRDIQTAVSFTETKPQVYVSLRVSISFGILLWLGFRFWNLRRRKNTVQETTDTEV